MKKLIIAAGLLMTTSAYAQTEVLTGVTRGKDYGVVYSLPKTQIELEIKALLSIKTTGLKIKWQRPTLPLLCSTIGATRLNFSVRNGKRWPPCAITTIGKTLAYNFFNPCLYSINYRLYA